MGLTYHSCPVPDIQPDAILDPTLSHPNMDFIFIDCVTQAMQIHGITHTAADLPIRPSVGDFLLECRLTGELCTVEVKQSHKGVSLGENGAIRCKNWSCFTQNLTPVKTLRRRIISAIVPVDIFMLHLPFPQVGWLVLHRDELPERWFVEDYHPDGFTSWWTPSETDFLAHHIIDCNVVNAVRFVQKLEVILSRFKSLVSTRRVPFPAPEDSIMVAMKSSAAETEPGKSVRATKGVPMPDQPKLPPVTGNHEAGFHGRRFESLEYAWLAQACRDRQVEHLDTAARHLTSLQTEGCAD